MAAPSTSDRHCVCLQRGNRLLHAKSWEKVPRRAQIWDPAMPAQGRATSAERDTQGWHREPPAVPELSSTSKPPQKSMDLTSSRDPPGAPELLQHHQTTGEIHGFYQFPFSSAIPSKHSPKFHLSEAHSMEFSPIWLHDHKTQHDNLIISIASIKFCSFQKFKSSVVTHQAWKNLNWIVPSY